MGDRQEDTRASLGDAMFKSARSSTLHNDTDKRPWESGSVKHLPWTGLSSLFVAFICGIGGIVVAQSFDDKPIDHWKINNAVVQPTVLLSILATLSKTCLGYAFTSGIAIFWWKSALRGTTLRHLSASQRQSSSLHGLCDKRPIINGATLASIIMLLLLAVGPFLQRALDVITKTRARSVDLFIPVSSSPLMYGSTGVVTWFSDERGPGLYSPLFAQILRQYNARDNITIPASGCRGTCFTDLVASGWDIACTSNTTQYRLMSADEYNQSSNAALDNEAWTGPPLSQVMFQTEVLYQTYDDSGTDDKPDGVSTWNTHYRIVLNTKRKATTGLRGELKSQSCTLSEALVKYRVIINGHTIALPDLPQMSNSVVQRIEREAEWGRQQGFSSTLGGLWLALEDKYASKAYLTRNSYRYDIDTSGTGTLPSMYVRGTDPSVMVTGDLTWDDPMSDMISMLQELTFRTAVVTTRQGPTPAGYNTTVPDNPAGFGRGVISPNLTATNRTIQQKVPVSMMYDEVVFAVSYAWLFGGSSLIALACLAIAPLYWGWWHLGRPVSLSPLEIAKAFDAPLMQAVDSNGTSHELDKAIGHLRVQYGFKTSSTDRDQRGESFEMDLIHPAGNTKSPGTIASRAVSYKSTSTVHDRLLGEHSVPAGADEVNTIDPAASPHEISVPSGNSFHGTGDASHVLTGNSHTVTTGLLPSTTTAVPATSSHIWRQARPMIRKRSLKFREIDFGIDS